MSDLISKEEAIKAIISESLKDGAYGYMDTKSIVDLLNDLPSAQPEKRTDKRTKTHACDSISRQSAIDALKVLSFAITWSLVNISAKTLEKFA